MNKQNNTSNNSIDNILKYLPYFKENTRSYSKIDKEDVFYPYVYSREVSEFMAAVIKEDFTIIFDWVKWQDEADKYFKEPELLDSADLITLRKLMTVIFRKERFCSGFINTVIDTGMILKILERLEVIRKERSE